MSAAKRNRTPNAAIIASPAKKPKPYISRNNRTSPTIYQNPPPLFAGPSCTIHFRPSPEQTRSVPEHRLAEVSSWFNDRLSRTSDPGNGKPKVLSMGTLLGAGIFALNCFLLWAFSGSYAATMKQTPAEVEEYLMIHFYTYRFSEAYKVEKLQALACEMALKLLIEHPPTKMAALWRLETLEIAYKETKPGDRLRVGIGRSVARHFDNYQTYLFKRIEKNRITALLEANPDLAYEIIVNVSSRNI
jgi:hypothetical protein